MLAKADAKEIARRVITDVKEDRVSLLAGGVAFYGLLALVPALVAAVSIYGLVSNPDSIESQIRSATGALPPDAQNLLVSQLRSIVNSSQSGLGFGAVIGIGIALWSASSGMKHLIDAINLAYDEDETRSYLRLRVIAGAMTITAVIALVAAVGFLTGVTSALRHTLLGTPARVTISIARFPLLALGMLVALTVLYRYAPSRDQPAWSWASWGAGIGTVIWILATVVLTIYASTMGRFNRTYGTLTGIILLMVWLLLTAFAAILGAEINDEIEIWTIESHSRPDGPPAADGSPTSEDPTAADGSPAPA